MPDSRYIRKLLLIISLTEKNNVKTHKFSKIELSLLSNSNFNSVYFAKTVLTITLKLTMIIL